MVLPMVPGLPAILKSVSACAVIVFVVGVLDWAVLLALKQKIEKRRACECELALGALRLAALVSSRPSAIEQRCFR